MKKRIVIIVVIFSALSIIGLMVIPKMIENDTVSDMNAYSDFGLDLLYKLQEDEWDDYNMLSGFGMDTIYDKSLPPAFDDDEFFDIHEYSEDHQVVFYDITSYPRIIGDYGYVTKIETTDPSHHLFGLSVGDEFNQTLVEEVLSEYHYKYEDTIINPSVDSYEFSRSKVTIKIYVIDDVISRIQVRIRVRNVPGVVF